MKRIWAAIWTASFVVLSVLQAQAQQSTLRMVTVDRPPFSTEGDNGPEGFSIDLMNAIAAELDSTVSFTYATGFSDMLGAVEAGQFDGAIANISITAAREEVLDFTQPIFASGIGVMLSQDAAGSTLLGALFTRDFLIMVVAALGLLFGGGMLMWIFERRAQPYFDRPAKDAMFPSFWWALNLVVNGGFEERMPQSRMGRWFAVLMVISSLFIVSIFVANITAAMTVGALQDGVDSVNDLEGRTVGTINGSTSADFLDARDIGYRSFENPVEMMDAFESNRIEAVVFDAPILAFYVRQSNSSSVKLMNRTYKPENYGIALPTGSGLREQIDQSLLRLRENGTYDTLLRKWFGSDAS